jgi:hypothetical protein
MCDLHANYCIKTYKSIEPGIISLLLICDWILLLLHTLICVKLTIFLPYLMISVVTHSVFDFLYDNRTILEHLICDDLIILVLLSGRRRPTILLIEGNHLHDSNPTTTTLLTLPLLEKTFPHVDEVSHVDDVSATTPIIRLRAPIIICSLGGWLFYLILRKGFVLYVKRVLMHCGNHLPQSVFSNNLLL